jgi:hypothetical protein
VKRYVQKQNGPCAMHDTHQDWNQQIPGWRNDATKILVPCNRNKDIGGSASIPKGALGSIIAASSRERLRWTRQKSARREQKESDVMTDGIVMKDWEWI